MKLVDYWLACVKITHIGYGEQNKAASCVSLVARTAYEQYRQSAHHDATGVTSREIIRRNI